MPGITRSNDAYGHELWACLTEAVAMKSSNATTASSPRVMLLVSPTEMKEILAGTGWRQDRISPGRWSGLCRDDYQDSMSGRPLIRTTP
jgi:hypothetical protein